MARIHVSTCSWAEKSLLKSGEFYPKDITSAEERLRFYAAQFDTVEVDSTYYAIPAAQTTGLWAERTPAGFTFQIKVYGALTGHGVAPNTLTKLLCELVPTADKDKARFYPEGELHKAIADAFVASLHPLKAAGKLGLLVFQYPPWFWYKPSNFDYILQCKERIGSLPMAVEFRQGSWLCSTRICRYLSLSQTASDRARYTPSSARTAAEKLTCPPQADVLTRGSPERPPVAARYRFHHA
jgi:uncharacterized protein YecE (DUF72 family)